MAGEPSVNPNALAAPAEGFGQTVSFAFDPRGEVPQERPITSQGPRMGSSNVSQASRADNRIRVPQVAEDPTAALLMKAGETILTKTLEEKRTAEFVAGMQRSMAGESVQEVKDSTPWYAKIWGDTPAIEGARAYSAQDRVNRALTEQVANIETLQQLGPEDAAKHFNGVLKSTMTGDASTDAVIMKGMMEGMPTVMKAQAKANYAWNQKQASSAMAANITSSAAGLQQQGQLYAEDKISEPDMAVSKQAFVRGVIPPLGINEESYQKTLTSTMLAMAQKGQFHALNALTDSGVMGALDPQQAVRVEGAIKAAATMHRDRYAFQYAGAMAEIKSDAARPQTDQTVRQLGDRIDKLNAQYKKVSGSPVELLSSDQKSDLLTQNFNAFKAETEKAQRLADTVSSKEATAAAKAAAKAELDGKVTSLIANGDVNLAKKLPGVTDDQIDLEVVKQAMQSPDGGAVVLSNSYVKSGYVNSIIKDRMLTDVRSAEGMDSPTDGWLKAVDQYNQLKAGPGGGAYAQAYFGDYAKQMERASRMLGDKGVTHPLAADIFRTVMDRTGLVKRDPLNAKENKALVKAVSSETNTIIPRWLGGKQEPNEGAMSTIMDVAGQTVEDYRMIPGMTDSEAMKLGVTEALNAGRFELMGGYAIRNSDFKPNGKKPTSLREVMEGGGSTGIPYIQIPAGKHDEYFQGYLKDTLKMPDMAFTSITRAPEAGGTQRFVVNGFDKDGAPVVRSFTAFDLSQYAGARSLKDTTKRSDDEPSAWAFGPKITYAGGEETVSPYASAEQQAAQRAKILRERTLKQANSLPGR